MTRPSNTERSRYLMQRSASLTVAMVTKPNPRDSLVQGSCTMLASITYSTISKPRELFNIWEFLRNDNLKLQKFSVKVTSPSVEKCFSRSRSVTRVDKPVTYRLFPGFSASLESTLLNKLYDYQILLGLQAT